MARRAWITPDETGDSDIARCLSIPENLQPAVNYQLEQLTYEANWEQVGTLTPAECAEAFVDILSAYYESECGVSQVYPDRAAWFWWEHQVISGNAIAINQVNNILFAGYWYQNTAAINNETRTNILLQAGTYTLRQLVQTNINSGQQSWYVDGVLNAGVVELYSAASVQTVVKDKTLTIPTDGLHDLTCKILGKNAASANYQSMVSRVQIWRTGA